MNDDQEIKITKEMIEAAAEVILSQAGDEWTRIDWAISIAEDALEAAFNAKAKLQSTQPITSGQGLDLETFLAQGGKIDENYISGPDCSNARPGTVKRLKIVKD